MYILYSIILDQYNLWKYPYDICADGRNM